MDSSRGFKNIIYGIVAQMTTVGLGIIIPRLVLVNLGSEANGLLNSVGSILAYMSLLEAGVGTATLQALYRPISNKDNESINSILSATNYFYRRTGNIYLISVIIMSIVYSTFIKTALGKITVFFVVLLSGFSGVLSYYFQGKYRILLQAEGKGYILSKFGTITTIIGSLLKVLLLINGYNVVAIQSAYFAVQLIHTLIIIIYIKKNYLWLNLKVEPDFSAISQKNAVLIHQISAFIFNNTDTLLLTLLTTLKVVSVYSMYALVFNMIKTIVVTIVESFNYALGQTFSDKKRFLRIFNAYEVYSISIAFSFFCITFILILPFLKLYTAGVTDINYIDSKIAWLFLIYYLLSNGRTSSGTVINIAQHFEKTKWRSVLESVINITASILLTVKFGIYGVLMGTIIALLYRTNDMIIYAARILNRSPLVTYRRWWRNIIIILVIFFINSRLDLNIHNYVDFVIYGFIYGITIFFVFLMANSIREPDSFSYVLLVIKNRFKR